MTTTTSTNTNNCGSPPAAEWVLVNPDIVPIDGWQAINDDIGGGHSFLIEYYKRCRSGEIIIGRELKTQLEMLLQDILYRGDIYHFTLAAAHKRIDFIESEIKHFESPFAGKPFILTLCQKAIAEAIFGFEVYDAELLGGGRWVRRYKEVLLLVARKNGKTPFIGALTLAEWFCGEAGQKVMCASNDYEQAGLIFDCINNFREESRAMCKVTRKNVKGIFFGNPRQRKKTGKFSAQNKGAIKKMSAKSGAKEGRNLKIVIVDEVHEMKDRSTVMPLRSSLTTQDEPLYFEITTEGIVRDGYLDERLKDARKVLRGELDRPRWLVWLYTQDSESEVWNDERSWAKSNPMLHVVKKISDLRDLVEEARNNGAQRAFTLAKEFNLKQLSSRAWLRAADIEACDGTFELADFANSWCIVGVDLAESNDLCSVTFLFMRPNDDTKYLYTMYFVTEAKANDPTTTDSPTNPERRDYRQWERMGLCRVVKGNVIDDDVVARYLREIYDEYHIRPYRVGYDEWHAKEFAKITTINFGDDVLTKIKMSYEALNTPTRTVEQDLQARHINYNRNEICAWCFRNTAVKHDNKGFVMPEKVAGYIGNKIDGTVSKIIAYATLRECKSAFITKIGG